MENESNGNNSWLQDNIMSILVFFCFILIILVGFFSYIVSDLKASIAGDKTTDINKIETGTNIPLDQPDQKIAPVETVNPGPQVQVNSSDPGVEQIVKKVFKHVFLPSGEVQIQTITNADELRKINPLFYQFAKSGDHILVYKDRAILYDPVADLVLDIIHIANK
ncbi:MAG: hypothetical protein A2821_03500 [Candidatus Magasanikbacteria bacterium RIFCSPHIGHO2_01_FULL_41_23]|uniref:Uncharacterized protein n=1 Tax=Candidatus Magasanikbacteria bacterium RIFCSPLOWO2_01_FULL_40_15 TaxID=1798686 RepID=A0A1F6N1A4_9BACT|nr:MAG: hypothetical protein A2821_03500 [Candidatus Magasanikbacteria bacterium RIFCSPHIGHO2_01_FULL_41_23]OGH66616.1 MAG: hypothetical protein A3C66_03080 [Candidatus Magasanikbacteria bacterium RIFCSPHIGHO2_02_FULL_41_35]OGH74769.1 MAG: hypothetical protein A3F22_00865 [Candidatus Magasanikbacteria bacterium RIFCSPHIGHO2_12_FULL_41_16]OGH77745.1 MAG: hypothetical protein A2983_03840 [Candidatus Magasanikbacteria bacterium RIFCSPLOWO2_01_FULL_40_15]